MDIVLSSCMHSSRDTFPKTWTYSHDSIWRMVICKVEDVILSELCPQLSDNMDINFVRRELRQRIQALHPEWAEIFEDIFTVPRATKVLISNILDYETFKPNGNVQRIIHSRLIQSRSPDYFFNWAVDRERKGKWFQAELWWLEYMRNYMIID